jgi:hypothetical protein
MPFSPTPRTPRTLYLGAGMSDTEAAEVINANPGADFLSADPDPGADPCPSIAAADVVIGPDWVERATAVGLGVRVVG